MHVKHAFVLEESKRKPKEPATQLCPMPEWFMVSRASHAN